MKSKAATDRAQHFAEYAYSQDAGISSANAGRAGCTTFDMVCAFNCWAACAFCSCTLPERCSDTSIVPDNPGEHLSCLADLHKLC